MRDVLPEQGPETVGEATAIERDLGEELREIAVERFHEWIDKAREVEDNGRPAEYERWKAYLWGQVHAGRWPGAGR